MIATELVGASPRVSARIAGLEPVSHGGASAADLVRQGIDPSCVADLIDLSTNVHPYGPPASVATTVASVSLERYPDANAATMRQAMAQQLGVQPEQVVAGNGSVELIYLLAQVYLDPGDRALVLGPTFGEYASAIRFCGAEVVEYRAQMEDDFRPDLETILGLIRTRRPKLIFCCNPNNPTGQVLGEADVRALMEAAARVGGLLVLDEAYLPLADQDVFTWRSVDLLESGPLVLLRSVTKDYAVPGLRLGYAIAPIEVGQTLNAVRLPWGVNAFAEAVGRTLLTETAYLTSCRERLAQDKAYLLRALTRINVPYLPSATNFCLIRVGGTAQACRRALLQYGVIVRDCTNFGLPEYIRASVHSREATDRLARGLAEWQAAWPSHEPARNVPTSICDGLHVQPVAHWRQHSATPQCSLCSTDDEVTSPGGALAA
jgi:histidinol-phosphate aminotransferase